MSEALKDLIQKVEELKQNQTINWESKPSPAKWSKKEIMGHLVDSALHNLQRFVEVQFEEKPYPVKSYRQDDWVRTMVYQDMPLARIFDLWSQLNQMIMDLISRLDKNQLRYPVKIGEQLYHLDFLIRDYVRHLQHHLNQINN